MTRYWNGGTAKERNEARLHSNQKPVGLMGWCLDVCGVRDGLVIDPFMGSGSLGVACHRAGLRYLGVEIDPEHYATAKARLERETAQGDFFL
jgi:DNA modification methylase